MLKIKKIFITIPFAIIPAVIITSCTTTANAHKFNEDKKIQEYRTNFVFNRFFTNIGLLKNSKELNMFMDQIVPRYTYDDNGNLITHPTDKKIYKTLMPILSDFLKTRFNKNFFKDYNLAFIADYSIPFSDENFIDTVEVAYNHVYINFIWKDKILSNENGGGLETADVKNKKFYLIVVPKGNYYDHVIFNKIDTIEKFKEYKPGINIKTYNKKDNKDVKWNTKIKPVELLNN